MSQSNSVNAFEAYQKYYIERNYEQVDLFRILKSTYKINKVIYPGSFIHISPSFIFPEVVYIDSDKNAIKFFQNNKLFDIVRDRKEYSEEPKISFYGEDYAKKIKVLYEQFDLLISQYAGFISDQCKDYLRVGGYLLVNNSHGDAGLASIDGDYELVSTVHKARGMYRLSDTSLERYFIPKENILVTRELLLKTGRGTGYTKTAPLYVFKRIS